MESKIIEFDNYLFLFGFQDDTDKIILDNKYLDNIEKQDFKKVILDISNLDFKTKVINIKSSTYEYTGILIFIFICVSKLIYEKCKTVDIMVIIRKLKKFKKSNITDVGKISDIYKIFLDSELEIYKKTVDIELKSDNESEYSINSDDESELSDESS